MSIIEVTTRELRANLSEVIGRAQHGGERIGITRNGKLAAVVISVDDLRELEARELSDDIAAYQAAKAEDDGEHIDFNEFVRSLS